MALDPPLYCGGFFSAFYLFFSVCRELFSSDSFVLLTAIYRLYYGRREVIRFDFLFVLMVLGKQENSVICLC